MTTATFDTVSLIPKRVAELDILVLAAKEYAEKNETLYNSLCRACCVLMASHLEGFLKELTKSLLADLNYNLGSFKDMPASMKRAFCKKIAFYEGVEKKDIDKRIKQLTAFFERNSVNIEMEAFSYKENPNKNPNSSFIDLIFEKFGINSIVSSLSIHSMESVFDNDAHQNFIITREMKRLRSTLFKYPFAKAGKNYVFPRMKKANSDESLWHTFISEVMDRRHSIAHGDVVGNLTTWEELNSDITKLNILMHGLSYSAADLFAR